MTFTRHTTISIDATGTMARRIGESPAIIRRPPVAVTLADGTDAHLAARLLRRLADEIERQGEDAA